MINRPKVKSKRQLEPRNDLHKPVPKSLKKTKVFGRASSLGTTRLAGPLSLIESKRPSSTSLKYEPVKSSSHSPSNFEDQPPVSLTHTIASILNGTEAYPRTRSGSHHPWERDQPSLCIDTHIGGISGYSRDSMDLNPPQPNEAGQSIYSSLRSHLTRESSMAAVSCGEHSVLSVSSGESSGSRGSNNSSSDSQQSGSTLRVVGRGGSGSRLRQFDPKIQKPDPNIVRQEHRPPLVRHSGRGGLGSRPKPLAAPLVPPKDTPTPKPPGAETPILIRPSGRGGLASRPKPPGSASPSLLKLLSKRKVRVNKGKEKAPEERRAIHPIPPNQTYSISNASSSTLSTIHFIEEAGEPSIPFFPNDQSLDSNHSDAEKSNTSPSSMFSSDQSSSRTTILSDQPEDNDEHPNESRPTTPVDHRQRNISKLTRTLGDLPDDVLFKDVTSQRPTGASPSRKNKNAKAFRRSGISMTSLGSMFSRSGGRARDSIATSTMTDDLHQFDLADDLSESWGNMNESSSSICRPPPSPIVFSPPSPLAGPNPKGPSVPNSSGLSGDESVAEKSTESDTLSCASSTLSRSTSFSIASSQRPSITSHNRSTSTSILSEGRLENNRSIWLIPIKDDDDDLEVGHIHRVNITDRPQNWSGEWNNDLHQVIKSLRLL